MDMLRNITAASAAASNPLLKSLLGPNASAGDYQALAEQAESVWKMMDELAENDPGAYQEFVRDAAKAAREEVEKGRDPHVEGLAPELVLEAQAQQPSAPGALPPGGAAAAAAPDVARVVAGGQAVARVHIWAANEASGVKAPRTAGGGAVSPQGPVQQDWSGLVVPVAEYRPATTRPGPLPVHHFHVACHVSGVRMCISGQPAAFRAAFLEAVTQFVEAEYKLQLSRTLRTLQVHREAVSESELQELLLRQQEQVAAHTGAEPLADDGPGASGSELPQGLLDELRTLNAPSAKAKQAQGPGAPAAAAAGSQKPKKPLIEELN